MLPGTPSQSNALRLEPIAGPPLARAGEHLPPADPADPAPRPAPLAEGPASHTPPEPAESPSAEPRGPQDRVFLALLLATVGFACAVAALCAVCYGTGFPDRRAAGNDLEAIVGRIVGSTVTTVLSYYASAYPWLYTHQIPAARWSRLVLLAAAPQVLLRGFAEVPSPFADTELYRIGWTLYWIHLPVSMFFLLPYAMSRHPLKVFPEHGAQGQLDLLAKQPRFSWMFFAIAVFAILTIVTGVLVINLGIAGWPILVSFVTVSVSAALYRDGRASKTWIADYGYLILLGILISGVSTGVGNTLISIIDVTRDSEIPLFQLFLMMCFSLLMIIAHALWKVVAYRCLPASHAAASLFSATIFGDIMAELVLLSTNSDATLAAIAVFQSLKILGRDSGARQDLLFWYRRRRGRADTDTDPTGWTAAVLLENTKFWLQNALSEFSSSALGIMVLLVEDLRGDAGLGRFSALTASGRRALYPRLVLLLVVLCLTHALCRFVLHKRFMALRGAGGAAAVGVVVRPSSSRRASVVRLEEGRTNMRIETYTHIRKHLAFWGVVAGFMIFSALRSVRHIRGDFVRG